MEDEPRIGEGFKSDLHGMLGKVAFEVYCIADGLVSLCVLRMVLIG